MYKITVKYDLDSQQNRFATIKVSLPIESEAAEGNQPFLSRNYRGNCGICCEQLNLEWGLFSSDDPNFVAGYTNLEAKSLELLQQMVDKEIFEIKKRIHNVVVGNCDKRDRLPPTYELTIDPQILELDFGFAIVANLETWRASLGRGDSLDYRSPTGNWTGLTIESFHAIDDPDSPLTYEIVSSSDSDYQLKAFEICPFGSQGWRHTITSGDILIAKTIPQGNYLRVDTVRSILHNFKTSQALITWDSDGLSQQLDYVDIRQARMSDLP